MSKPIVGLPYWLYIPYFASTDCLNEASKCLPVVKSSYMENIKINLNKNEEHFSWLNWVGNTITFMWRVWFQCWIQTFKQLTMRCTFIIHVLIITIKCDNNSSSMYYNKEDFNKDVVFYGNNLTWLSGRSYAWMGSLFN